MTQTSSGEFPVYQGVLMRIQEQFVRMLIESEVVSP